MLDWENNFFSCYAAQKYSISKDTFELISETCKILLNHSKEKIDLFCL